jgi:sugar/nucleoside kinase (ribokinase family)
MIIKCKGMEGQNMNHKKWDLYVYGDVNIDLVIPEVEKLPEPGQEEFVPVMETFVGGGAALFTLGTGKLGLHPVFQAEIGDDLYGEMIRKTFRENHVDDSLLETSSEYHTGISISFTNEKDRSFLSYKGTNEKISLDAVRIEQVKKASHIHVTGYAGSENHASYLEFLRKIKEETDVTVSFDVGWDATGEWKTEISDLFPYIDVLFMNETEAVHYGRKENALDAAQEFAKQCSLVVIKMGSQGSMAIKDGELYQASPYQVKAVDTTGAGDSFNAGFVYGFLRGKSVEECLKCGNGCGALSVTALGGNTGFPTEKQLMELIG